jgi:hypothetical protein
MKYKIIIIAAVIILLVMVLLSISSINCNLSDKEAIEISKSFYNMMGIRDNSDPFVANKSISELIVFGSKSKLVVVGDTHKYKMLTDIGCKNKDIIHFSNNELRESLHNRYSVTVDGKRVLKRPPFLAEEKAQDIILSYGSKIGLPNDVEYSGISLDKSNGIWTARWKRKFNGYVYDDDYIVISIMAVNGDLYGFTKWLKGKPCSTEVKVSNTEAIIVANKEFANYFNKDTWEKNKDKFEVKSAELKIVQDKSILKRILSLNGKSRLAWVIVFDTKPGFETRTIGIIKKDVSIIRIDAVNKKVLSSEINIVP